MSPHDPTKKVKLEPMDAFDELMEQAQAERIGELHGEELQAELRSMGIESKDIPTPEQVLAGALAWAAAHPGPATVASMPSNVRPLPAPARVPAPPRRILWL